MICLLGGFVRNRFINIEKSIKLLPSNTLRRKLVAYTEKEGGAVWVNSNSFILTKNVENEALRLACVVGVVADNIQCITISDNGIK